MTKKMVKSLPDDVISEKKIYGDDIVDISREVHVKLIKAGLWTEWDHDRQSWIGRVKDVETIEEAKQEGE